MKIAEIYESVQGEGLLTGTPSVFVRASGCNLRCWFCDTPYSSWYPEGDDLSVDEIVSHVRSYSRSHVVMTGGEPMLFAELVPVCERIKQGGAHITIETAGTLFLQLHCDLMSISPKLANSTPSPEQHPKWSQRHDRTRHTPEVVNRLLSSYPYQLKFVVACRKDCADIREYLDDFPNVDSQLVMLMPEGTSFERLEKIGAWLEPYCMENGFVFCPRKQIEWFGSKRGT